MLRSIRLIDIEDHPNSERYFLVRTLTARTRNVWNFVSIDQIRKFVSRYGSFGPCLLARKLFAQRRLRNGGSSGPIAPTLKAGSGGVRQRSGRLIKGVLDRCIAFLLLLWLSPLLLLIAVGIRLDSPGPALFRQRRAGLGGAEFDILKFRTMSWEGPAAGDGAVQTVRGDARITRIGTILRQSSLDEVPQLFNVLAGSMSLVGPRPHPIAMRTEHKLGEELVPDYAERQRVKPGLTGWAQINGLRGATATVEQLRRRVEHDNFYIENWSLALDLRIIAATPASLLVHRHSTF